MDSLVILANHFAVGKCIRMGFLLVFDATVEVGLQVQFGHVWSLYPLDFDGRWGWSAYSAHGLLHRVIEGPFSMNAGVLEDSDGDVQLDLFAIIARVPRC